MPDDKNKKGLGRGLMSLFGDQVESRNTGDESFKSKDINNPYLLASIGDLTRNESQPRIYFDENKQGRKRGD